MGLFFQTIRVVTCSRCKCRVKCVEHPWDDRSEIGLGYLLGKCPECGADLNFENKGIERLKRMRGTEMLLPCNSFIASAFVEIPSLLFSVIGALVFLFFSFACFFAALGAIDKTGRMFFGPESRLPGWLQMAALVSVVYFLCAVVPQVFRVLSKRSANARE